MRDHSHHTADHGPPTTGTTGHHQHESDAAGAGHDPRQGVTSTGPQDTHSHHGGAAGATTPSLNRQAVSATVHCLTGCAIGEVLGMVIASALGWSALPAVALAVVLAFFFGYLLTIVSVRRVGLALGAAIGVAFAADTVSIAVMEIVDNAVIVAVPGAMEAGLTSWLFWAALALGLGIAFVVTVPVNR